MKLRNFIMLFILPHTRIRLIRKLSAGYEVIGSAVDSKEDYLNHNSVNSQYLNKKVLGIYSYATSDDIPEAVCICINA